MAQDLINTPPIRGPVDDQTSEGKLSVVSRVWSAWFTQVFQACFAIYQSGTTAQRPTETLWVGRRYYDTTLNKPIYYTSAGWRDATGALV